MSSNTGSARRSRPSPVAAIVNMPPLDVQAPVATPSPPADGASAAHEQEKGNATPEDVAPATVPTPAPVSPTIPTPPTPVVVAVAGRAQEDKDPVMDVEPEVAASPSPVAGASPAVDVQPPVVAPLPPADGASAALVQDAGNRTSEGVPPATVPIRAPVAPTIPTPPTPVVVVAVAGRAQEDKDPVMDVQAPAAAPPPPVDGARAAVEQGNGTPEDVPSGTAGTENAAAIATQNGDISSDVTAHPAHPAPVVAADSEGAQNQARVADIVDLTADEECDSVVEGPDSIDLWDPRTSSYTPATVLSSIPGNIRYKPVYLPLQRDETRVGDKSTARADLLGREVVQTFLKNAGCVVLQPLEERTPTALRNIINSLPSERITQESEDVKLNPQHFADVLGEKEWPLHPMKGSSLTMEQLVSMPFKPDIFRWKICQKRLGAALTDRLFYCFTSKYNLFLLPTNNSTDRTWARSRLECEYVAIMQNWTHSGSEGVHDANLGYKDLPLLQLEGFFQSRNWWWLTQEASTALIAQDYMARLTDIDVPFDAFEAMALSYEELLFHFPKVDAAALCSPRPFPKMRSLASYYYCNQLSRPHGLPWNSRRRRLLKFAHKRETYIFVLHAVCHNWTSGRRLFTIARHTLSGMYKTNLHRVPKNLLGLPIAPAVIMDRLQQMNDCGIFLRSNIISSDLPMLGPSFFLWVDRAGGTRDDIEQQEFTYNAGESFTMPECPKETTRVSKKARYL